MDHQTAKPDIRINGIVSLIYGVDELPECTRFFVDFGLHLESCSEQESLFRLPDRSTVVLRHRYDPVLGETSMVGSGVRKVVWGLDTAEELDWLANDLKQDHEVVHDSQGGLSFVTDFGVAMGLELFARRPVAGTSAPSNSTNNIQRMNVPRRWRERALPKAINHVVMAIPDFERASVFMRDRLGFRLSDEQVGFGKYLRAGGCSNHHTLLLLNANADLPGMDGEFRFHHANFAVDDIDEIMVGANHMTRQGWEPSHFGLGRHRIDSALFYYLPCPAGGEAEYGTDSDCTDDSWVPRQWPSPLFGYAHWVHDLPPFLTSAPPWKVNFLTSEAPRADGPEQGYDDHA